MSPCRHLVQLLAVVLVIQGVAAVVPHRHSVAAIGSATTVDAGQALTPQSPVDEIHHCFACSVHTPVVEPGPEFGPAIGETRPCVASIDQGSNVAPSSLDSASPRGPPSVV